MGFRALSLLLPFACAPAGSSVLPSTCRLSSAPRRHQPRGDGNFNGGAATSDAQPASATCWARRGAGCGVPTMLSAAPSKGR